jgi:mRNA interferase MazF
MTDPVPRRAEIWLARLDKVRPVVILTRDPMGALLNAVIAAPVTSTIRGISTEVPVGPKDGVRLESVVSLDNVQLVARSRLVKRIGQVSAPTMSDICHALSIAVECDT